MMVIYLFYFIDQHSLYSYRHQPSYCQIMMVWGVRSHRNKYCIVYFGSMKPFKGGG